VRTPSDSWLIASPSLREIRYRHFSIDHIRATAFDFEVSSEPVGVGYGETQEQAAANAMNSIMVRQHEAAERDDAAFAAAGGET